MSNREIHIKADNPKGLAYDELHTDPAKASNAVRTIIRRGGVNVTVNGKPVPDHFYEMAWV